MNKNILIILGVVILCVLLLSGGYLALNSNKMSGGEKMMQKDTMKQDDKMMDSSESIMKEGSSRYIEYSKSNLENAEGKRILFFYASWCPTCRPVDEEFNAKMNEIPEDTTIIRVNYNDPETDDEEKELAKKYGITYHHTFVQIDENGNEITKWNGGGIDELVSNIK